MTRRSANRLSSRTIRRRPRSGWGGACRRTRSGSIRAVWQLEDAPAPTANRDRIDDETDDEQHDADPQEDLQRRHEQSHDDQDDAEDDHGTSFLKQPPPPSMNRP